jgi:hypothetical protein
MSARLLSSAVAASVCAFALAACGGSSGPKATPTPKVPSPEDVIGQWVKQNRNIDFVGTCANAKQGVDVGKLCVSVKGQRGSLRAYDLGPTFSDPTALALVQQGKDGTWSVLSVANVDPSNPVPGIDWPLQVGDQVVIVGLAKDDCLNVRDAPSQKGKQLACEPQGVKAVIQEGPTQADNFTWWKVAGTNQASGAGFSGWAAGKWLRLPDSIAQALQPHGSPTPGAAATPGH